MTFSFYLALHTLAAVVWVGGTHFARVAFWPGTDILDSSQRCILLQRVLRRYFIAVWVGIALVLGSGFGMVFWVFGGTTALRPYIRVMMMLGVLTAVVHLWLYLVPWTRVQRALRMEDWQAAAQGLARVRWALGLSAAMGLITAAVGAGGRYLPYG
jgi:uncharacterized membrane protein